MRQRFRRSHGQTPELDITAFMNLMVILVPFLLITAVFNQVNILEMNLPEQSNEEAKPPKEPPPFQLEIILRKDGVEVGDKPDSILKTFPLKDGEYDLDGVVVLLKQLKARFPDDTTATLLLEPEVPYDRLIQVMDTVRSYEAGTFQAELFPDIAMGDAPAAKGSK
ncbi:ExbD/TolR family protein [Pseudomonadota bacterium]